MKPIAYYAEAWLPATNLLLTAYGGAALATAARLKWDPSTYVVVRELFPAEYRVLGAALCGCGAAMLLLPLLAAAAARAARPTRRIIHIIYAGAMTALCVCEAAVAGWLVARAVRWLSTPTAAAVLAALDTDSWVRKALNLFLPDVLERLIKEASEDAPVNLYVVLWLGALLALLQAAAILLAVALVLAARASQPERPVRPPPRPAWAARTPAPLHMKVRV